MSCLCPLLKLIGKPYKLFNKKGSDMARFDFEIDHSRLSVENGLVRIKNEHRRLL